MELCKPYFYITKFINWERIKNSKSLKTINEREDNLIHLSTDPLLELKRIDNGMSKYVLLSIDVSKLDKEGFGVDTKDDSFLNITYSKDIPLDYIYLVDDDFKS